MSPGIAKIWLVSAALSVSFSSGYKTKFAQVSADGGTHFEKTTALHNSSQVDEMGRPSQVFQRTQTLVDETLLPTTTGAPGNGDNKLFMSNRHTNLAVKEVLKWMNGFSDGFNSITYSGPKYNLPESKEEVKKTDLKYLDVPPGKYDIEVFGASMMVAISKFFLNDELKFKALAEKLEIPWLSKPPRIEPVKQKNQEKKVIPCLKQLLKKDLTNDEKKKMACTIKAEKGAQPIKLQLFQKPEDIAKLYPLDKGDETKNKEALERMVTYSEAYQKIKEGEITTIEQWKEWIEKLPFPNGWKFPDDWETLKSLHYDNFLHKVFGLDEELAYQLTYQDQVKKKMADDVKRHETNPIKWLSKAVAAGFAPPGCFADVVNLVFAILGKEDYNPEDENLVENAFKELEDKLAKDDLTGLWIPTHFVMDGEVDDILCWILLERLLEMEGKGTQLQIFFQLPKNEINPGRSEPGDATPTHVHFWFADPRRPFHERIKVLRDQNAENHRNLNNAWDSLLKPKGEADIERNDEVPVNVNTYKKKLAELLGRPVKPTDDVEIKDDETIENFKTKITWSEFIKSANKTSGNIPEEEIATFNKQFPIKVKRYFPVGDKVSKYPRVMVYDTKTLKWWIAQYIGYESDNMINVLWDEESAKRRSELKLYKSQNFDYMKPLIFCDDYENMNGRQVEVFDYVRWYPAYLLGISKGAYRIEWVNEVSKKLHKKLQRNQTTTVPPDYVRELKMKKTRSALL